MKNLIKKLAPITALTLFSWVTSSAANAASIFGNGDIRFGQDTVVKFDFLESHGIYKSDFGVQQAGSGFVSLLKEVQNADDPTNNVNDWVGSCGISILNCMSEFTFKANTDYKLVLQSYEKIQIDTTKWGYRDNPDYTVDSLSSNSAQFSPETESSYTIAWNDGGGGDTDFNDFRVKATIQKTVSVPEPATVVGLGLVGAFFTLKSRKKI